MKRFSGYLQILGAAFAWGVSATAAKGLMNASLHPYFLAQMRVSISLLVLAGILGPLRPALLKVQLRHLWRFALLGIVGVAGANVTYYVAMKESTVAIGILLQYSAPLLVMGYAVIARSEKIDTMKVGATLLSVAGCFLALGGSDISAMHATPVAIIAGIASAFCFAFLTVFTRHSARGYEMITVTIYAVGFASLFWLVVRAPGGILPPGLDLRTWGALILLAFGSILIPYVLYFHGLRTLEPSRAMVCSTLEPVVAITSAALFLGEVLTPIQAVGALMVIVSIAALQLHGARRGSREETASHGA
jgi:drug/metabolite transporter (DMT)-like permease